jgi:LysR family glycine cleavage system transcriptional activator
MRRYHERHGDVPIRLDSSTDVRDPDHFDMAIRTGSGHWPSLDVTPLMPVEATAMLSPRLAASMRLSSPADLLQLPLLAHDDWPRWFREAGVHESALRYCADEYPTHELDAAAAVEGAGVALLSPTLFGSLIADGKLVQPFEHVMRGPAWHYFLHRPGDARSQVLDFRVWLQSELRSSAARTGGISS